MRSRHQHTSASSFLTSARRWLSVGAAVGLAVAVAAAVGFLLLLAIFVGETQPQRAEVNWEWSEDGMMEQ